MKTRALLLALTLPFWGCGSDDSHSAANQAGAAGSNAPDDAGVIGGSGGSPTSDGATSGANDGPASAHAPNPKLAGIADGNALDLGRFTCTSPDGEDPSSCRQMTDYSGFVYDPRNHQIL